MKRIFSICILMCVLFSALCGCGSSPSTQSNASTPIPTSDPDVYPVIADAYYIGQTIAPPPDTIYTTSAAENGLDGELYTITGTVTDIQSDDSEYQYTWILIETESGPVVVGNPSNYLLQEIGDSGDTEKCKSYFASPSIGDFVCIYSEYMGYSDAFDCAAFIYGGADYMTDAVIDCMGESQITDTPDIDKEQDPEIASNDDPVISSTTDSATASQRDALDSANSYLSIMAFSHSGLIEQLEYEGFSTEDATYAADNCGADWNEQALLSGQNYLEYTAFSYSGLIDQLEYEGFTTEQATYGADNCGADWNEQAAKSAAEYLEIFDYSRDELIDQLEYEGFTAEQAAYGAYANGF